MVAIGSVICLMSTFLWGVDTPVSSRIEKRDFGKTAEGRRFDIYVLRNKSGMEVSITNYGGGRGVTESCQTKQAS